MGRLTNTVREQYNAKARSAPVPDWMPKMVLWVGIALAVVVGAQAVWGWTGGSPVDTTTAPQQYIPSVSSVTTTSVADPSGSVPATTAPSGDGDVVVRNLDGETIDVPEGALITAEAASLALVTGDLSGVPISGTPPVVAATPGASDPQVTAVLLLKDDGNTQTFSVAVAPGPGVPLRNVTVTVANTGSGWVWTP